jgi:hypothetical protein
LAARARGSGRRDRALGRPGLAGNELLSDRLTSPLLPGFDLDIRKLFADVEASDQP